MPWYSTSQSEEADLLTYLSCCFQTAGGIFNNQRRFFSAAVDNRYCKKHSNLTHSLINADWLMDVPAFNTIKKKMLIESHLRVKSDSRKMVYLHVWHHSVFPQHSVRPHFNLNTITLFCIDSLNDTPTCCGLVTCDWASSIYRWSGSSMDFAILHCLVSTVAQNGQTKHRLQRKCFTFLL